MRFRSAYILHFCVTKPLIPWVCWQHLYWYSKYISDTGTGATFSKHEIWNNFHLKDDLKKSWCFSRSQSHLFNSRYYDRTDSVCSHENEGQMLCNNLNYIEFSNCSIISYRSSISCPHAKCHVSDKIDYIMYHSRT